MRVVPPHLANNTEFVPVLVSVGTRYGLKCVAFAVALADVAHVVCSRIDNHRQFEDPVFRVFLGMNQTSSVFDEIPEMIVINCSMVIG